MIRDSHIEKEGKLIEKVSLIYIDGDAQLCDACDEVRECAVINTLNKHVMIICQGCLQEIINEFN